MKILNKKILFFGILLINVILFSSIISATYSETSGVYSPAYNHMGGLGIFSGSSSLKIDESMCQQGTDFIVQISPLSCEPTVVTSDLLAEENVNVFCKMTGTKINPLVDVSDINSIGFAKEYPRDVVSIGYMPAQSALGYTGDNLEGSLLLDNLGYVVVTLRKQPNESALTNCEKTVFGNEVCWVEGTLTATFNYDVKNSFGVGNALFYLPLMDESEWMDNYVRYSFWDGRGYLRAESIDEDSAVLSVYSDKTVLRGILEEERRYALQKYSSNLDLKVGEESNKIYLPGLSPCLASLQLKLEGVEDPDTFVRIKVNDDYLELRDGESFLDGKCVIQNLDSKGVSEEVQIKCREDDSSDSFYLRILPKVDLEVNEKVDSYEVGDYLYQSSDGKKFVYLGYVGVAGDEIIQDSADAKMRLYTYLVALPIHKDSLSDEEITSVAKHAELIKATSGKTGVIDNIFEGFNKWVVAGVIYAGKYIINGEDFKFVPYNSAGGTAITYEFKGGNVALEGLSKTDHIDTLDESGNWNYVDYYQDAMSSFDTVINSYSGEVEDSQSLQTEGELALIEEINLAKAVAQGETMLKLCKQFAEDYPDSIYSPESCLNPLKFSNSKNAIKEVIINGQVSDISFEGISSPGVNEYSARVIVTDSKGKSQSFDLRKDKVVSLSNFKTTENELKALKVSEYIILEELTVDSATIKISVDNNGANKEILIDSKTLKKGVSSEKYGDYTFVLTDVTLKKVAKVSITANTDFAKSNSTFNFKIGIEKRAIQLSPEKAAEKIIQINKSIESWEKVSKTLGGVVSAGKAACIATEGFLTVKNLIANRNGGAIARQEVMTGEGGWNKMCEEEMRKYPTKYSSLNSCFLNHSDEIDSDVNRLSSVINKQNQIIDGIASENSEEFIEKLSESVGSTVNSLTASQSTGVNNLTQLKEALNSDYLRDKGAYSADELKEIQMYAMYLQNTPVSTSDEFRNTAIQRLNSVITDVNKNSEEYIGLLRAIEANQLKINPDNVILIKDNQKSEIQQGYGGETLESINLKLGNLKSSNPIATAQINGVVYVLILDGEINSNYYPVKRTTQDDSSDVYWIYDGNGNFVKNEEIINKLKDYTFQKIDAASFKNPYQYSYGSSEILLKYSGTYAYRDKPVVVPFDKKEGWYAGIKSPETAYDASGVIREFWLCNVGEDGIEEFQLEDFGGDYCLLVNTAQANDANPFSKLVSVPEKIKEATAAIYVAQKKYKDGIASVWINANVGSVKVGEPLTESSNGECTDFMSVEDCTLLFNVCDPVICPSSRCDYGGKYPVQDVIQTGVVGSLFLCYPNAKWEGGDIYVPFCLSGINAGLESWISVKQSYADCLQKSIDTGETVGICDEMHSIYLCEFFWKQAIPVAKLMGSKIIEKVIGQSSRGGGEYQSFMASLKNAQNSIDYFTQYYAVNSNRAFKSRSTEEIGAGICGTFASVVYPDGGTFLSNLIAPDSPFQFTGKFEETSITTATNPPTSHYKVYFHIYAGTDSGAYYRVELRGSGSSYYQDTAANRVVDSGYIAKGESADESIDFTAPSGYSTLCITVNGQEECGFKEVSTSFAVNYLSDLYVKDQADDTDIKTKDDCTSGSASLYSLLDLNIESIADNLLNSELYAQGIIRTCSTESPGAGTDANVGNENARWKKVGYCDDENIGCWIDTDSVKDAIKALDVEEDAIGDIDENAMEYLSNTYYSFEEFKAKKEEIKAETNVTKRLEIINLILNSNKVFYNNQKAYLYLEKGKAYASLAIDAYTSYLEKKATEEEEETFGEGEIPEGTIEPEGEFELDSIYVSPVFKFRYSNFLVSVREICYMYFDSKWHWTSSCDLVEKAGKSSSSWTTIGEINTINGNYGSVEIEDININKLREGDKELIASLDSKSYIEGLELLIKRTDDEILKLTLSTKDCSMDNKFIFVVDSGVLARIYPDLSDFEEPPTMSYYYRYVFDNAWQWSPDNSNWMKTDTLIIRGGEYDGRTTDKDTLGFLVIQALKNKDLYNGAVILFDPTSKDILEFFGVGEETTTSCTDTCSSLGYQCGTQTICSKSVNCGTCATGQTCNSLGKCITSSTTGTLRDNILKSAENLDGAIVKQEYNSDCSTAVNYVYQDASCGLSNCIYSAKSGQEYKIVISNNTLMTVIMGTQTKIVNGKSVPIFVTANNCVSSSETLTYADLLKSIIPGDRIDFVYDEDDGHGVIFINWVSGQEYRVARVFDWNGARIYEGLKDSLGNTCTEKDFFSTTDKYCKSYRYVNYDLSISRHPIYRVWNPVSI